MLPENLKRGCKMGIQAVGMVFMEGNFDQPDGRWDQVQSFGGALQQIVFHPFHINFNQQIASGKKESPPRRSNRLPGDWRTGNPG